MRCLIVLLLAACGTHEESPPPPERFRPQGFEVRIEGERMHASISEPDRCRELVSHVRIPAVRTQLFSERVLVVGCADRWLRLDIDVQSGDAEIVGGSAENHDVVLAAKWLAEHAEVHDSALTASLELAKCTMESEMPDVTDALACIEERLRIGRAAFDALPDEGVPEDDLCEWQQRSEYAQLTADAMRATRAPRRFRSSEQLVNLLRRFDAERYERVAYAPLCSRNWYLRFSGFDCVQTGRPEAGVMPGWRCNYERAAAGIPFGFVPIPRAP